jgi:hypothetical protein
MVKSLAMKAQPVMHAGATNAVLNDRWLEQAACVALVIATRSSAHISRVCISTMPCP